MRAPRGDLHFQILEILAQTVEPIGSGAIHQELIGRGLDLSQPTVGRALFHLDAQGLTHRVSNKGRQLTPEGRKRFEELLARHNAERLTAHALMTVGKSTLQELHQAMVARKAIEKEIARLAAEYASPEQIQHLRRLVESQRRSLDSGRPGADEAVAFHLALGEACGNHFLADAAQLVRTNMATLQRLMYHLGASIGESYCDHAHLLEAVAGREPAAAEKAMSQHMNELIRHIDDSMQALRDKANILNGEESPGEGEAKAAVRSDS